MPLTANASGQITGSFTIPANVPVGTKRVTFLGNQGSFGAGRFVGEGTIITRTQRLSSVSFETRFVDPLAQTFRLDQSRHITAVDFWFTARGNVGNKVYLEIRETEVGLPNTTTLAEGVIQGSAITVGAWNKIGLTRPVFLQAGVEYAMVLLTDDPVHAVGLAELGKLDAAANQFVTSQPYTIGTLLKSSNASTWTPVQESDLTFRMYGAQFTSTTRTVNLGQLRAGTVTITRSGTTATATMAGGHPFTTGQKVVHSGANQTEYNGAFTISSTGANTYTFTVSGTPATPATGTILVAAGDVTDLVALAGVERISSETDAEFIFTRPDGSQIRGADNALIQLAEDVNVALTLSAVLRGTTTLSPYLFAGTQAVLGNLGETGTYVSRAIPCAANAKVSCTFEALLPGASSVLVEFETSTGTWQTVALTSSSAVGDGWVERIHTVASFTAGGTTTRVRLTLTGAAAARPQLRQLRLVVI
jgi:hypothetical protein